MNFYVHKMKCLLLLVLVCLTGCGNRNKAQVSCNADFDSFFEKFTSDSMFQKKHVDFPIMEYYSDEDFPLDMMERMTDEDSFEIIHFDKNAKSSGKPYEISIDKKTDSVFCYKKGINNPINIKYTFVCKKDSWFLVAITDTTD